MDAVNLTNKIELYKKKYKVTVVPVCNLRPCGMEAAEWRLFKASLGFTVSTRLAWATECDTVL